MTIKEQMKKYNEIHEVLAAYNLCISTVYFDKLTIAPKKGVSAANKSLGIISTEYFKIVTGDEYVGIVSELFKNKDKLNEVDNRKITLSYKNIADLKNIPQTEYTKYQILCGDSEAAWEKAKNAHDYSIFEPYLIKVIEFQKKFCNYRNPDKKAYDLLLDDYEEGMNIAKYDEFFELIKTELVPLIKKISNKQETIDDSCINGKFNEKKQAKVMKYLRRYLGFYDSWGYMGVSAHPFTDGFSNNDVRITTAYNLEDISSSIFSVIHETGHATLEHQVASKFDGTIIKSSLTSAIHESQSRLFENNLGRSTAFWESNYPKLQRIFKKEFEDVSKEEFVKAINCSKPSFVRTESDELTYSIHILIRYEIEKGIFDGTIDVKDLREVWNQKYYQHLGVKVEDDSLGILQDIHWSDGSFGYFPTYSLGSAYAAQIENTLRKDLDVDYLLSNNQMRVINKWLKDNLHQYGALYSPDKLILKVTGEKFNPKYYIEYLKEKYSKLYDVK
jgi:carboxypeptidase Taq